MAGRLCSERAYEGSYPAFSAAGHITCMDLLFFNNRRRLYFKIIVYLFFFPEIYLHLVYFHR